MGVALRRLRASRLAVPRGAAAGAAPRGREEGEVLVLGCDTVVEVDGVILEKPRDAEHAAEMLRTLRGNTHQVHTGVALILLRRPRRRTAAAGAQRA